MQTPPRGRGHPTAVADDETVETPRSRQDDRGRGTHSEVDTAVLEAPRSRQEDRGRGMAPETVSPVPPSKVVEKPEEEYEDRGDFALRQENYVRPYFPPLGHEKPPAPFPEALKDTRTPANDKEIFETFSNCEVNIPLLKLIKTIPRYAKFLKELCTLKRKQSLKGKKKVQVSERVSAMIQKQLPSKCEDPGMFTIPIEIGNHKFGKAMLDLRCFNKCFTFFNL